MADTEYWKSLENACNEWRTLSEHAHQFLRELPAVKRENEKILRVEPRLGRAKYSVRAARVLQIRHATVDTFYKKYWAFLADVQSAFGRLQNVLPLHEVQDFASRVHPKLVQMTCETVVSTMSRVNEFWQARAVSGATPSQSGKRGPRSDVATFQKIAAIVLKHGEQWRDGTALEMIVGEIDNIEIPVLKAWRRKRLKTWTDAFEDNARLVVQAIEYRLRQLDLNAR